MYTKVIIKGYAKFLVILGMNLLNFCVVYQYQKAKAELDYKSSLEKSDCSYFFENKTVFARRKTNPNPIFNPLLGSMCIDTTITAGLASINPYVGGAYGFLGALPESGRQILPNGSLIWCGHPDAPAMPPYNSYYLEHYKDSDDGCALSESQKDDLLRTIVSENSLLHNIEDQNERQSMYNFLSENGHFTPHENDKCFYEYSLEGGLVRLKNFQNLGKR